MPVGHIAIVGAGDCGTRAALRLRELDSDLAITLIGDETEEPYERPGLSKSLLTGDVGPTRIASTIELADAGIHWRSGSAAVRIDPDAHTVTLANGSAIGYDRLLIATGARARRLAVPGGEVGLSVRSTADARRLRDGLRERADVLVVGGGFIGLEVAASARQRGSAVTVIEFAHQLMSRVVPVSIGRAVHQRHLDEGVDLRTGVGIVRLDRRGGRYIATLDDDAVVSGSSLVAGIGAIPNTELAATAGLPIANGIAVDATLRTADPDIFAAGDCCSVPHPLYDGARVRLEAWRSALAQADVAARNLLGEQVEFDVVPSFWSDQYDLTMQVVGLHAAASSEVARRRADGHELLFGLDTSGRLVSASGVAPGTTLARDISLAERLIAARARPAPTLVSDPTVELRQLVREVG
jgi:3-phenylpropionate/trans-cinnamate dioxygenase ferredoxin reductase subunit